MMPDENDSSEASQHAARSLTSRGCNREHHAVRLKWFDPPHRDGEHIAHAPHQESNNRTTPGAGKQLDSYRSGNCFQERDRAKGPQPARDASREQTDPPIGRSMFHSVNDAVTNSVKSFQ